MYIVFRLTLFQHVLKCFSYKFWNPDFWFVCVFSPPYFDSHIKIFFFFLSKQFYSSQQLHVFPNCLFFRTVACVCFRTKIYSDKNDRDDMHNTKQNKTKQKKLIVYCLMIIETIFNCRNSYFFVNQSFANFILCWNWKMFIGNPINILHFR